MGSNKPLGALPSDVYEVLVEQLATALVMDYQHVKGSSVDSPGGTNRKSCELDRVLRIDAITTIEEGEFVSCSSSIR